MKLFAKCMCNQDQYNDRISKPHDGIEIGGQIMSHNKRTYVLHTTYYKRIIGGYEVTSKYTTKFTRHELAVELNSRSILLESYDKLDDCDVIVDNLHIRRFNSRYGNEYCSTYVTRGDKRYTKDEVIKLKAETDQTYKYRQYKYYNHPKTFRDLPIPYVHHSSSENWYRHPKLGRQRKQNNAGRYDEHYEYNNTKYAWKTLPTWDDRPRPYGKSWKDCTKRKHQYKEIAA